MKINFKI